MLIDTSPLFLKRIVDGVNTRPFSLKQNGDGMGTCSSLKENGDGMTNFMISIGDGDNPYTFV